VKPLTYEFKYTEQNLERASDFETKTLLFLLGIDQVKSHVFFLFIDCFNDLSGTDKNCSILWDYQSKGVSNMTPRDMGKSLFTLFENYSSKLNFGKFALFIPPPNPSYITDQTLLEFGIANFGANAIKVREGLEAEVTKRKKTALSQIDKTNIGIFLDIVIFVLDRGEKQDYIKNLVHFKDKDLKSKEFYSAIFNEIRTVQFNKKLNSIHGEQVNSISETLAFNKHLESKDISILVVNRLIGIDLFKSTSIPIGFLSEVASLEANDIKDLIIDCHSMISRALFDKNNKVSFWKFLERSMIEINNDPSLTPKDIYNKISNGGKTKYVHLSGPAGTYLISLIKEGLEK
jgi:hypothetical protein